MKTVIVTVGTSINDNLFTDEKVVGNDRLTDNTGKNIESKEKRIENKVNQVNFDNIKIDINDLSAEISSLCLYYESHISSIVSKKNYHIKLFVTDTMSCYLAANLNKKILEEKFGFENVSIHVIPELNLASPNYDKGTDNFIMEISKVIYTLQKQYSYKPMDIKENVLFCIAGGYKVLIPYMTIISQFFECEIIYKHEEEDKLIPLPRIPISFDPVKTELLYIALNYPKSAPSIVRDDLESYGFISKGEKTALGELFCQQASLSFASSKTVSGHVVEMMINDYFITRKDKINDNFSKNRINTKNMRKFNYRIKRSVKKETEQNCCEYDFIFYNEDKPCIGYEVKSIVGLNKTSKRKAIYKQICKNIKALPELEKYYIIFYAYDDSFFYQEDESIEKLKQQLKSKHENITFKIYKLTLKGLLKEINNQKNGYKYIDSNLYESIVKNEINDEDFCPLISDNDFNPLIDECNTNTEKK